MDNDQIQYTDINLNNTDSLSVNQGHGQVPASIACSTDIEPMKVLVKLYKEQKKLLDFGLPIKRV